MYRISIVGDYFVVSGSSGRLPYPYVTGGDQRLRNQSQDMDRREDPATRTRSIATSQSKTVTRGEEVAMRSRVPVT